MIDGTGTVTGFVGAVTLQFARNGGSAGNFAPPQVYTFTAADAGVHRFVLSFSRRGSYVVSASDGGERRGSSVAFTVT